MFIKNRTNPTDPWDLEDDKYSWRDETTKLPCLIVRGRMGNLCGYVGVYSEHALYNTPYDEFPYEAVPYEADISVHGGLTYGPEACAGEICHIAEEGEPEPHWFGFDCAHSQDLIPGMPVTCSWGGIYRNVEYVRENVTRLARQLQALKDIPWPEKEADKHESEGKY